MFQSYNKRLAAEIAQRDCALAKIQCHGAQARAAAGLQLENLKTDAGIKLSEFTHALDPKVYVRKYPWASILGALVAGFAFVPVIKSLLARTPKSEPAPPATQRVVIEVAGAGNVSAQPHEPAASHWKMVFDTILHGLPIIAAYAQQHFGHSHGTNGKSVAPSMPEAAPEFEPSGTAPFIPVNPSISRRSTPPPP